MDFHRLQRATRLFTLDVSERRVSRLQGLLERLQRHLKLRQGAVAFPGELADAEILWPGENGHVVLLREGAGLVKEIREVVREQARSSMRWREDTFEIVTDHTLERFGRGELSAVDAAQLLGTLSDLDPDPRWVLVGVHGVHISDPMELCGIRLHPSGDLRQLHERVFGLDVREQFIQMRIAEMPAGKDDSLALVEVRADEAMAAENARLRVLIALCVLHAAARTEDALRLHPEYTAGIVRTQHSGFMETRLGQKPQTYRGTNLERRPLGADQATLELARQRPGIAALERLAQELPAVPPGSRVERVLRAAQLLGRSMDGDADDRFLRRWMALEALINPQRDRVVEHVTRRASWLLFEPSERKAREKWFSDMYDRRSRLAHGDVDRTPFDFEVVEFGWLAFDALERVAALQEIAEIDGVYPPMSDQVST